MTCKEKFAEDQPHIKDEYMNFCPVGLGYIPDRNPNCSGEDNECEVCWNQEVIDPENVKDVDECLSKIKEIKNSKTEGDEEAWAAYKEHVLDPLRSLVNSQEPHILDSGDRTEFASGAVRDMREGKGRCDLLPLDVVYELTHDAVFDFINKFQDTGNVDELYRALLSCGLFMMDTPGASSNMNLCNMLLEVAKHFEEGCKKYGENNWRKGIPIHCYIDSAVRHYLKWLRGDKDEPHDRAFCWNILCCIWTVKHIGLDNEVKKEENNENLEV